MRASLKFTEQELKRIGLSRSEYLLEVLLHFSIELNDLRAEFFHISMEMPRAMPCSYSR